MVYIAGNLGKNLREKINGRENVQFDNSEEYYYALGQIVVYIFEKLGGADIYRREFSYLTCPTIPYDALRISRRVVHFLENLPRLINIEDKDAGRAIGMIFAWNSEGKNENINFKRCEEAFYDGVYEENVLL